MTEYFLIATIVVFSFHLAGHIFDKIAIIPNWNSGEIIDMKRNKDFFRKGQIRSFFGLMILSCFVFSLVATIQLLGNNSQARVFSIAAFVISTLTNIWSVVYFIPMNKYFDAGEYDAEKLKITVKKWISANHIRFILLSIALLLSIGALLSYKN